MTKPALQGRKVLVVGLARSGMAAIRFLISQGAEVSVTDKKTSFDLEPFASEFKGKVTFFMGGHRDEDFLDADLIVLSPGVPTSLPPLQKAVRAGRAVWSEVELAWHFLQDARIVGITGSNGKTTTTTLIGELFRHSGVPGAVAGNIGAPLIGFVGKLPEYPTLTVELSSFQLETIHHFRSHIAVLLNVTPDHLDRYPSFQDYARAKARIFLNQTDQDFAVINIDDPVAAEIARQPRASTLMPFSRKQALDPGVSVVDGKIRIAWAGHIQWVGSVDEIQIPGVHNLENVLAATAAGFLAGLEPAKMLDVFRSFSGVEHRLEKVRTLEGIDYYNDSKATNVDSAIKGLDAFTQPLVVIMGGLDKGGDFTLLRDHVQGHARAVVLIGQATGLIEEAIYDVVPVWRVESMEDAVYQCFRLAQPGDVVLLSPACASFDMFKNYEERGHVFKELVRELAPRRMANA